MVHEQRNRLIPRSVGAVFRLDARIFSIVMPPKCFVEGLGPWFSMTGTPLTFSVGEPAFDYQESGITFTMASASFLSGKNTSVTGISFDQS